MPDQFQLTEEEQDRLLEIRQELRERGYQDITEHGDLRVGARIRHRGQQFTEAFRHGTGYVVALMEKPDSAWSRTYRMPDIELVVVFDKPALLSSSRLSQLAQYHVSVVEVADV